MDFQIGKQLDTFSTSVFFFVNFWLIEFLSLSIFGDIKDMVSSDSQCAGMDIIKIN